MTRVMKIQLRQSEIKSSIGALLDKDHEERSDDDRAQLEKLAGEAKALEVELRAAIAEAGLEERTATHQSTETAQDTPEAKELRSLVSRASIGRIIQAVARDRPIDGPESELQQHFQLDGNMIPLDLMEERGGLEDRAAATFTSGGEPQTQSPIIARVFPQSAAAFAGVSFERVPVGERTYPVLHVGANVHTPAKSGAAAESTAEFVITNLGPKRAQASFAYSVEDAATFPELDGSLRSELMAALEDKIDERVLNTPSSGLLTFGTNPGVPTLATWSTYVDAVYGSVDGKYAGSVEEVRLLLGAAIYGHTAKVYRANGTDLSALAVLRSDSGGVRVAGNTPAYSGNRQEAVAIRGVGRRNMVVPLWGGVEIIEDPYSRAGEGERRLFAVLLYNVAILREDGFVRYSFRNA